MTERREYDANENPYRRTKRDKIATTTPDLDALAAAHAAATPEALAIALNRDLFSPVDCVAHRRASPHSVEAARAKAVLEASKLLDVLTREGFSVLAHNALPDLIADNRRLTAERDALREALVEAAIPLEAMLLSGAANRLSNELRRGIIDGVQTIRAALGGHDA